MNFDYKNILNISLKDSLALNIEVGFIPSLILIAMGLFFLIKGIKRIKQSLTHYSAVELSIKLGGIGDIKIKPNHEVAQIAHKAWAELITRKAGLPFDEEHDVIVEIYNSWYELFKEMRSLIKDIPADQIKNENTQLLVNLLVDSLNKGLRPHLTRWQAKFRRWYDAEIDGKGTNKGYAPIQEPPQEIQKRYPLYKDLIADLKIINIQLVEYTNEIKKIVQ